MKQTKASRFKMSKQEVNVFFQFPTVSRNPYKPTDEESTFSSLLHLWLDSNSGRQVGSCCLLQRSRTCCCQETLSCDKKIPQTNSEPLHTHSCSNSAALVHSSSKHNSTEREELKKTNSRFHVLAEKLKQF